MFDKKDKINAVWNSLSFTGISVLGFINFSLNYNTFSSTEFGIFILINSIFGIGNTLDFGFGVSTVKYIAEERKNKNFYQVNKIFVSFLILFSLVALLIVTAFVLYYFVSFRYSDVLAGGNTDVVMKVFLILLFSFYFRYLNNYLGKVFEGFGEFVLFSKVSLANSVMNTSFMVIIFFLKLDIIYLSLAYLISGFFTFLSLLFFSLRNLEHLKFNYSFFSLSLIRKYAVYSMNIQASFFVGSFVDPVVKYFLGRYLALSYVTYFESAKKIIDLSNGLIFSAQKGLLNKLSESNAVNKLSEFMNTNLSKYSKMSNYYSILIYGLFNTFLCYFVFIWFRSYESMIMLLVFFLPFSLINFAGCLYLVLMIEGKGVKLLLIQSINLVFITFLVFISINYLNNYLGILGYYFAMIITLVVLIYFLVRYNGFNFRDFIRKVEIFDLVKLNLLIFSEFIVLFFFKDYLFELLFAYTFVYFIIFRKYLVYFYNVGVDKIRKLSFIK